MKASNSRWKEQLGDAIAPQLSRELDIFENEIALKKQGKIDDKVFAFYGTALSGTPQQEARWKRGVNFVTGALADDVSTRSLGCGRLTSNPLSRSSSCRFSEFLYSRRALTKKTGSWQWRTQA